MEQVWTLMHKTMRRGGKIMQITKRGLALFLSLVLIFSFSGCANDKKTDGKKTGKKEAAATTQETAEETDENMISDGTFDNGTGKWNTYTNGGSAAFKVNGKKQLEVDITSVGSVEHAVQLYYDGFALETGCKYHLSFDIASDVDRVAEWRIQLNGGDYHAYASDKINLTKDMTTIDTTFEMTEGSDPAPRFCFNLGKVEGCPDDLAEHAVTIDNISLTMEDDSNKVEASDDVETKDINVDQLGYETNADKQAVVRGDKISDTFDLVDQKSGKVVFSGKITDKKENAASGEKTGIADFSEYKEPGTYVIQTEDNGESFSFAIGDDIYKDLKNDVFKMLTLQRCGMELTKEYAGAFAHKKCHTGKATVYGTKEEKDVSGGWHDAGDYGRYVVSGAKTVADLLLAYEQNPDAFSDDTGIMESGNGTPDILDEVRYECDWLLKMQADNGGVYHKVTCLNFPETVMPEEETDKLYLAPISNTATGDFAAVMAMTARVFKKIDPDYSAACLAAAKKAVAYFEKHKDDTGYKNPTDLVTGEYPDDNDRDEYFWALAELYKTTGDKEVHKKLKKENILSASCGLGWQAVGYYGIYAYATAANTDADYKKKLTDRFSYGLDDVIAAGKEDAYHSTTGQEYTWGSNLTILNNAMMLQMAKTICPDKADDKLLKEQLHYVLGKNTTSYCFVTGYGSLTPTQPHHRPSQVLEQAMKGMIVGGPDSNLEDPYAKATMQGVAPAKCYVDNVQSYSCNEVTIYWNSPLVYVLAME